jgi:hypothetical protein
VLFCPVKAPEQAPVAVLLTPHLIVEQVPPPAIIMLPPGGGEAVRRPLKPMQTEQPEHELNLHIDNSLTNVVQDRLVVMHEPIINEQV